MIQKKFSKYFVAVFLMLGSICALGAEPSAEELAAQEAAKRAQSVMKEASDFWKLDKLDVGQALGLYTYDDLMFSHPEWKQRISRSSHKELSSRYISAYRDMVSNLELAERKGVRSEYIENILRETRNAEKHKQNALRSLAKAKRAQFAEDFVKLSVKYDIEYDTAVLAMAGYSNPADVLRDYVNGNVNPASRQTFRQMVRKAEVVTGRKLSYPQ